MLCVMSMPILLKKSLSLGIPDYLLKDELNPVILFQKYCLQHRKEQNPVWLQESEQMDADRFQLSRQPFLVF